MPLRSPDHPLKGPPGILIVEAGPTLHGRPPACAVASPRAMALAGWPAMSGTGPMNGQHRMFPDRHHALVVSVGPFNSVRPASTTATGRMAAAHSS